MRRKIVGIVTLTVAVLIGTLWGTVWNGEPQSEWDRITNPYYGWGSPVERAVRLVPPLHRYFYRTPLPIFC